MKAPDGYCDKCLWAVRRDGIVYCPFLRCVKRSGWKADVK